MKNKFALMGIPLALATVTWSLLEPYQYRMHHYHLHHPSIPSEFENYRILFIADIHFGRTLREKRLKKIIHNCNHYQPDLILLGGDYITHKKYISPCFHTLQHLKSKDGIFAIMGNHDVVESEQATAKAMKQVGIHSANNEAYWIYRKEQRIKVGGVGDLQTQSQLLHPTIHDASCDDFVILLTHNPRFVYQLPQDAPIDLILAGHTHGAQFSLAKHLTKILPKQLSKKIGIEYLSGHKKYANKDVIVSNGLGTAKFPFRFLTLPEVCVITLHQNKTKDDSLRSHKSRPKFT